MSSNYDEIIQVAEHLLATSLGEHSLRSSVSRSYYGAFHACVEMLPDEFAPPDESSYKGESHKSVVNAVEAWGKSLRPGRTDAQQAGRKLAKLKQFRKEADYVLGKDFDRDAVFCVAEAKKAIAFVSSARQTYDLKSQDQA
ncbi:hypothetical protein [Pandoraea sp. PE-S2R-1]|uniref:hypothetical protein n=1 Tax=Pandoraea sp. PE-S2R-1 TaxID=1986994 RepID=UPI000B3FACEC|nr:hypothetical protein [Pandoraea sp. PE-S2R-1]